MVNSRNDSPKWLASQARETKNTTLMFEMLTLCDVHDVTFVDLAEALVRVEGAVRNRNNTPLGRCKDCDTCVTGPEYGNVWEYYNVLDEVWAESGLGPDDGMLCIGCLEARIGRELHSDDFGNCLINTHPLYTRSPRFIDRLNRVPSEASV